MSDFDSIERQLRRAFRAVAEQPISGLRFDPEKPRIGPSKSRFPRHLRVVSIAFVAMVTFAVAGLVVAYGPFRSRSTSDSVSREYASTKSRLQAALNSTFNSSGYVSISNVEPTERVIWNSPDLTETIDSGLVSEIDVGNTDYTASWAFARKLGYRISPDRCGPHARFIESTPEGAASINYSFQGAKVDEEKNVYSVMRNGTVAQVIVVLNGYVVEMKRFFATGKTVVTSYSEIGHAPKIVVPNPNEVVAFPQAFLHGCPI
jgi:hypothetical protein